MLSDVTDDVHGAADFFTEDEDDTKLVDEVSTGCAAVGVGEDSNDEVGGMDDCVGNGANVLVISVVSSLTEYDDEFASIDVVDDTDCCEVAETDDGCSDDAVDDCAEYDCGFGTTDVKVGEIDVCDDVEDGSSAEAVDDAASAVYAEVNDVADDSADCEEVADGDSVEVRDGAVSDGSVSTKVEDEVEADTVGVEVADS
ncbi:hypothetical protein H4S07_004508 [Coemansia furcata]|uniref:Uncharacterized protein n=1 Tax=Coemansia furcata TaxID=417177 RepID=A0ACC1L873_9FUNG|nr:hypothetical protein H4S07_004508 [Coemansia furcata]